MKAIQIVGKPLPTHFPRDVEMGHVHVRKIRKQPASKRKSKDVTSGVPHPCTLALLILTPLLIGMVGSLVVLSVSSNYRQLSGNVVSDLEATSISSTETLDLNQVQHLVQDIHRMLASAEMLKGVSTNGEAIEKVLKDWLELLNRIEQKVRETPTSREDKPGATKAKEQGADAHVILSPANSASDYGNTFVPKAEGGLGSNEEGSSVDVSVKIEAQFESKPV